MKNTPELFWRNVKKTQACWLWKRGAFTFGYGAFRFEGKLWHAHRLAYLFIHGHIPTRKMVLHRCDVPACVNPAHLYLGTQLENIRDRVERGRSAHGNQIWSRAHPEMVLRGEANPLHKLSELQVMELRRLYAGGNMSYRRLATRFGIWQGSVRRIVKGIAWKHVHA